VLTICRASAVPEEAYFPASFERFHHYLGSLFNLGGLRKKRAFDSNALFNNLLDFVHSAC
jgi:hypothetical protein